jgi:uncharacterized protein YecT (DUF1311 family)
MPKLLLGTLLLILLTTFGAAQTDPLVDSQNSWDRVAKALDKQPSCSAAADYLEKNMWGSSADVGFAYIVINKCEKAFLRDLTPEGKTRYNEERYLCRYEYANQEGTLSMSEAAMCGVWVAAQFAANPGIANRPAPRASFECRRAESPLEKAICSDKKLGQADIVLGRVYKAILGSLSSEEKPAMSRQEKVWLNGVMKKCGVGSPPLSSAKRSCVRSEFEARFSDLDGCLVGGGEECLREGATQ